MSLNEAIAYPIVVFTKGTIPRHNAKSYSESDFLSCRLKMPSNWRLRMVFGYRPHFTNLGLAL